MSSYPARLRGCSPALCCGLLLSSLAVAKPPAKAPPPPAAPSTSAGSNGSAQKNDPKNDQKSPPPPSPQRAESAEPAKPANRDKKKPVAQLPLSPTPEELRQMERRRRLAEQQEVDPATSHRRLPTQTGNTAGPGNSTEAGSAHDRKSSVSEGIGPTLGGVRR